MSPTELINYFGNQSKAAIALELKQPNISRWVAKGSIPILRQYQIESLTKGKLKPCKLGGAHASK